MEDDHASDLAPAGARAELEFSSIDDPPSPCTALPLVEGTNRVLIRIRGGRYASGGFFAAVKSVPAEPAD